MPDSTLPDSPSRARLPGRHQRATTLSERITERGRLALAGGAVLAVIVGTAVVGAVRSGDAGPIDPLAEGVPPTTGVATSAPATPSAAPSVLASEPTTPAASTSAPATAASPPAVIVNGRAQPPRVEPPTSASGNLVVVPGAAPAFGGANVLTYRVEVEDGLPFDGAEFAEAVRVTLSDGRSWPSRGWGFQRVDGEADMRVILASPALVDRMCAPLRTNGQVSCRAGAAVIINALRWGTGAGSYGADIASYREYVINHEVGHRLGFGHTSCPAAGQPAPVMMQQTYGLDGCAPNPWPAGAG